MTHPLAAVPKKGSTKLRIVVDMTASLLDESLIAHRFILPQVEDVARKCYGGAWLMCVDLVDGFYSVEVAGPDRKYLGLKHPRTGKYYRYTRLAMGSAASPAAFSRLVSWAVQEVRKYPEFDQHEMVINDTDTNMPRIYGVDKRGAPTPDLSFFVDDGLIIAHEGGVLESIREVGLGAGIQAGMENMHAEDSWPLPATGLLRLRIRYSRQRRGGSLYKIVG
jgi:hypothetical protein